MRVVLGRRQLEQRPELGLRLVPALEAEVRDPERLADRGLVGLALLRLLERTVAWAGPLARGGRGPAGRGRTSRSSCCSRYGKFSSTNVIAGRSDRVSGRSRRGDRRPRPRARPGTHPRARRAGPVPSEVRDDSSARNQSGAAVERVAAVVARTVDRRRRRLRRAPACGAAARGGGSRRRRVAARPARCLGRSGRRSPAPKTVSAPATRSGGSAPAASARRDGVGRPVAAGWRAKRTSRPRSAAPSPDERLDLLGEVPGDDGRAASSPAAASSRRSVAEHRPPVDRQDRLRPALGQRAEPAPLARGHDDRVQRLKRRASGG